MLRSGSPPFDIVAEIEPPTRPDLGPIDRQLAALRSMSTLFVVPDNHTGRATVSSLVVAHEVQRRGHDAIACLNARDRNLLGLRRDLLTAGHLGIDELLLVYGDEPEIGERSGTLNVRAMLEECIARGVRTSVTSRLRPLPAWKQAADRLFVQVTWSIDDLLRWRERITFDGPVYAGAMVLPSAATARRLADRIPELRMPASLVMALDDDGSAGVRFAADLVGRIRQSGAFDGVHLIAGNRGREIAALIDNSAAATALLAPDTTTRARPLEVQR